MFLSKKFVSATHEKTTLYKNIPAPYMRRDFILNDLPEKAEITVCGLGFYEIFVNGQKITRGRLSPYIVNPDEVLPYDNYVITDYLVYGENTVAFVLGNGMQNRFDGFEWSFDEARFNSAPKLAFAMEFYAGNDCTQRIEADEKILCHSSPIYSDGLHQGEKYDARREIPNWNMPGCDLSDWTNAIPVPADCGEPMLAECNPVAEVRRIQPVAITKCSDGAYLYDFGENCAGLTELNISGYYGQHIKIDHGEWIKDGEFTQWNLFFRQPDSLKGPKYVQRTEYICHGGKKETYIPSFTYYGFRYAKVFGITENQATEDLLSYVVINTDLKVRAGFNSSDNVLNKLQEMTVRSDLANFLHFPTDCPHREKNGWTGDAALSAEQMLMNLDVENNYNMWLKCIGRAMNYYGAIPGIVPTGGWGFHWGNGPAWDMVMIWLPYYSAVLRDDLRGAKEMSACYLRYFHYLKSRTDENGLISIGLGDLSSPKEEYRPPVIFTDSVLTFDMAKKAAYLYRRLDMEDEAVYCDSFAEKLLAAIRKNLIEDKFVMRFIGGSQTAQAMAIFYNICINEEEKKKALNCLVEAIHQMGDHLSTGILGSRVIFRVLCDYGYEDLAHKMITRPDAPSYGFMVARGDTTLCEDLVPTENSFNHHFFGDVSALMLEYFGGIRINPEFMGADTFEIKPVFPDALSFVNAWHDTVNGKITVEWKRDGSKIILELHMPQGASGKVTAPNGYAVNGADTVKAENGSFVFTTV